MNREQKKKWLERRAIESFLNSLGISAGPALTDGEKPDFVLHLNGRSIGIEHTRVHRQSCGVDGDDKLPNEREQEALQDAVVRQAQERFEADGGPPLLTSIHFNGPIPMARVRPLSEAIAERIKRALPTNNELKTLRRDRDVEWQTFPKEVGYIHLYSFPEIDESRWTPSVATWVPRIPPSALGGLINTKEYRLPSFDPACDEFWLVLVAEGNRASSLMHLVDDCTPGAGSRFDRVYYHDLGRQVTRRLA